MRGYYKSSKSVIRAKLEEKDKLFDNGDHYRGGWAQGGVRTQHAQHTQHAQQLPQPEGSGRYRWADGSVYEGEWKVATTGLHRLQSIALHSTGWREAWLRHLHMAKRRCVPWGLAQWLHARRRHVCDRGRQLLHRLLGRGSQAGPGAQVVSKWRRVRGMSTSCKPCIWLSSSTMRRWAAWLCS